MKDKDDRLTNGVNVLDTLLQKRGTSGTSAACAPEQKTEQNVKQENPLGSEQSEVSFHIGCLPIHL
jgi:hypothetical protein